MCIPCSRNLTLVPPCSAVTSCRVSEVVTSGAGMTETLQLRGTLRGHNGWVTQITTSPKYPDMILSSSRDKSLIVWKLNRDEAGNYGVPQKRLHGHR